MGDIENERDSEGELDFDDMEWQRKTCQHIIRMIKDEQVLLDEALHPKVVKATLEVIHLLLIMAKEEGAETQ
ncbi:hypothetical protein [Paenibacillus typhae]|uniref:Uncharacterized protein n=1 Tax=Paenibacillus typhae TaxID=1174501 RepID=A0A1G8MNI8_9BACL|nr:hypothetical protein [Paenibacillus typhae]SDI69484.1 hypothetical protein SAMN05216192_107165 [Paenibacillus typhae]